MPFPLISIVLLLLTPKPTIADPPATPPQAYCCKHNLRCCLQPPPEPPDQLAAPSPPATPSFEIRALLRDCPNPQCVPHHHLVHKQTHCAAGGGSNQTNKPPERLTNCKQKLLLTIKILNEGPTPSKNQYVIVDHINEPSTGKKVNILNPFAVRIRQEPVMQMYPLTFLRLVNAEAKEKVLNRHVRGFGGCEVGGERPTCGAVVHGGRVVPFSTGFCCDCRNGGEGGEEEEEGEEWGGGGWKSGGRRELVGGGEGGEDYGFASVEKRADNNYEEENETKNELPPSNPSTPPVPKNRRGDNPSDCAQLPPELHQSAHCLVFSHLWYAMYEMEKPKILHRLQVQIFQKYEDCHGNTHWLDLTQGRIIDLSNESPTSSDGEIGIMASYDFGDDDCDDILDYQSKMLLIPEKRVSADQFMLIPNKMVSHDGRKCNTVGVGYEAFYKQKKRCAKPPGSCLGNQPNHLFAADVQASQEGRIGKYFLSNFASPSDNPLGYNARGEIESLKLIYAKRHESKANFEINADLVTLMKPNVFATITEVYTDATDPVRTEIVVKVTNSGLLYGVYYVRLSGCPLSLPASLNNIASKSVLITAQHQHIFKLFVEYSMAISEFTCNVHVHNINQEMIAARKVRIRAGDRCICVWHCKCVCYINDNGLRCVSMGLSAYHEAGFQGGMPIEAQLIETSWLDDVFALFFHMFLILVLTLLVMGLLKSALGLYFATIGFWGLDVILGTGASSDEQELACHCGISKATQLCLNVIFFFIYPLALINQLIGKLCLTAFTNEKSSSSCVCFEEECGDEKCFNLSGATSSGNSSCKCSLIYTTSDDKDD